MVLTTLKAIPKAIIDLLFGLYLIVYGVSAFVTFKPLEVLGSKYAARGVQTGRDSIGRGTNLLPF